MGGNAENRQEVWFNHLMAPNLQVMLQKEGPKQFAKNHRWLTGRNIAVKIVKIVVKTTSQKIVSKKIECVVVPRMIEVVHSLIKATNCPDPLQKFSAYSQ